MNTPFDDQKDAIARELLKFDNFEAKLKAFDEALEKGELERAYTIALVCYESEKLIQQTDYEKRSQELFTFSENDDYLLSDEGKQWKSAMEHCKKRVGEIDTIKKGVDKILDDDGEEPTFH